mgnify:FL=1
MEFFESKSGEKMKKLIGLLLILSMSLNVFGAPNYKKMFCDGLYTGLSDLPKKGALGKAISPVIKSKLIFDTACQTGFVELSKKFGSMPKVMNKMRCPAYICTSFFPDVASSLGPVGEIFKPVGGLMESVYNSNPLFLNLCANTVASKLATVKLGKSVFFDASKNDPLTCLVDVDDAAATKYKISAEEELSAEDLAELEELDF